jgi:hypothetical protein
MTQGIVPAADELEELRKLKARYCRFLDTKDVESWRIKSLHQTRTMLRTSGSNGD